MRPRVSNYFNSARTQLLEAHWNGTTERLRVSIGDENTNCAPALLKRERRSQWFPFSRFNSAERTFEATGAIGLAVFFATFYAIIFMCDEMPRSPSTSWKCLGGVQLSIVVHPRSDERVEYYPRAPND